MSDQAGKPENQQEAPASERSGLRHAIRQALDFSAHVIETGKVFEQSLYILLNSLMSLTIDY